MPFTWRHHASKLWAWKLEILRLSQDVDIIVNGAATTNFMERYIKCVLAIRVFFSNPLRFIYGGILYDLTPI